MPCSRVNVCLEMFELCVPMSQRLRTDHLSLCGVCLRPATVDDVAAIRHVHAAATRASAAGYLDDDDISGLVSAINCEAYIHAVISNGLTAAWIDREIVGTVGWKIADKGQGVARLQMLFVWPMFARGGIGRLLVSHAEAQAHAAGVRRMRVRTTTHQSAFFKRLGYTATAQSALRTVSGGRLPIAYLRKDEIFPDFPFTESVWTSAGHLYRH